MGRSPRRPYLPGSRGDEIDLLVDEPQAARDIPRAAETSGHHLVAVAAEGSHWRITLEV